jgi:hypothetical protein
MTLTGTSGVKAPNHWTPSCPMRHWKWWKSVALGAVADGRSRQAAEEAGIDANEVAGPDNQ